MPDPVQQVATAPAVNQTTSSAAAAATQTKDSTSALSSDFETFLLMLTTQLENQDPLNPIESQDFAVQLATFSGVEQQVLTNDLLRDVTNGLGASGLAQLAGWVGMEGRVSAPVAFDGTPVDIALAPDPGSDAAELIVRDSFGREVSRQQVPLGNDIVAWAGTSSTGDPLPTGNYTLELASLNQGEVTSTRPVSHYARIEEARQGTDGIELVISGGAVVASNDVTALRDP